MAKAGLHLWAATLLAALAGAGLGDASAQTPDAACLAAPNAAAPAGSHWYYRTNQSTHHKCWYVRPADQIGPAAAQPESAISAAVPAQAPENAVAAPTVLTPAEALPTEEQPATPIAAAPKHTAALPAQVPMPSGDPREHAPVTTATTAIPVASLMPTASAMPATSDSIAWPAPPALPPSADSAAAPPDADQPPPAAIAATPDPDNAVAKSDAEPHMPASPQSRMSVLTVLSGLIVLLIAGVLLRRVVARGLERRRSIKVGRQEPRLMEPIATPPSTPPLLRRAPSVVPNRAETPQQVNEVEEALREFAQNLRRRRSAPAGTAARAGAWVRS